MNHIKKLKKMTACDSAIEFAEQYETIEEVIDACPKGEWLAWLAGEIGVDKRKQVLAAGRCANTVIHLMHDQRSIDAVNGAIAYGNGEIGEEELIKLADAAAAAAAANADFWSARYAAAAAAAAARAANADFWSARYAAAWAAAAADAASQGADDRETNELLTADICREVYRDELIKLFNNYEP